ncbi:MAG: hypothetical protein ACKO0V_16350 [bacterium]
MKSPSLIVATMIGLFCSGCGSDSSTPADAPKVSPEAKKENAPEKVKGKQVTKSNMPSMKYVD